MSFRITELHAFVTIDPKDNQEGIIGELIGDEWMPFIAADHRRIEALRPRVAQIAKAQNLTITLARFSIRENVETFTP